jgi:Ca2+-binding RTX toxin-like protein
MRVLVAAVTVIVALSHASLSTAGTVTLGDGTLEFTAAAGEQNRIFILQSGAGIRVFDMNEPMTAGPGCQLVSQNEVFCAVNLSTVLIDLVHVAADDMNDFVEVDGAFYRRAVLEGGEGADELQGGAPFIRNILDGGPGSDIFRPGFFGGASDVVDYSSRTNPVTVTLGDGLANDGEAGEQDLIEDGIGQVSGGSANDTISSHTGIFESVELFGRGGDDTLTADGGADSGLHGGAGDDTLVSGGSSPQEGAFMFGGPGADILRGGEGLDFLTGGDGNDRLRCGDGGCVARGGGGADRIVGGPGYDGMGGGAGRDTLFARDGKRDLLNGGAGRDRARVDRFDRVRNIEEFF